MLIVQQLKLTDFAAQEDFAHKMQVILGTFNNVILLMKNEAYFHLNEIVNRQKLRYWDPENPYLILQRPYHSEKVSLVSSWHYWTLFFAEDRATVTVYLA